MSKINYQNLPSTSTPLNATNLNAMQEPEDSGWIDITLLNDVTARSGDIYKPQYRRIGDVVYLKGQINVPQHSQLSAFQLPSGYRPAYEVKPPILNNYYDAWIAPNGTLYIGTGNAETSIDMCVSFLAN